MVEVASEAGVPGSESGNLSSASALDGTVTLGSRASPPVETGTIICPAWGGRMGQRANVQESSWLVAVLNMGVPRLDGNLSLTRSHAPS